MNGLPPLNDKIAAPLQVYQAAKTQIENAAKAVQRKCSHDLVLHADYKPNSFGSLAPLRMCAVCRLEEEGSHWSSQTYWNAKCYGPAVLGESQHRIIVPAPREEIYRLRLPGPRYLAATAEEKEAS